MSATPQQIGKAFVVQYYRLLHEHPESLHRFYSSSSTFMHDDPNKTVTGTESIAKRIEELSLKQRHVKIRQVDCHSTVGSSVVVQVCGEISSSPILDPQTQPNMKRFVQTFVLTPADNSKQKYYVHNDIFRYQDSPLPNTTTTTTTGTTPVESPITPSAASNIEFFDNTIAEKKDETTTELNTSSTTSITPPVTPVVEQTKEQTSKPKSYRDAIGKKEKATAATTNANTSTTTTTTVTPSIENQATTTTTAAKPNKSNKQQKKAAKANGNTNTTNNTRSTRGHPQDANDYYDDSWYYGGIDQSYLSTGYTDDQEIFVGNLSAQVTEHEIHELFQPYGSLLLVRIGNTGSQVGAANFAFVVCESIEMAKTIVADHEKLHESQKIHVEAKKRRPFSHTFRPTYPTAALPTSYQSTGYPASFYHQTLYYEGAPTRGARRGGKSGAK